MFRVHITEMEQKYRIDWKGHVQHTDDEGLAHLHCQKQGFVARPG